MNKVHPKKHFAYQAKSISFIFALFLTYQMQAITPVNPQKGDPTWTIATKLGIQADELMPIHLKNESLIEEIDINLQGTLNAVQALSVSACDLAMVYEDFNETWTILEEIETKVDDGFAATWTAIQALSVSACDLAMVYEDFNETWTILEEIETKVDDGFAATWTAIQALSTSACDLTMVYEDFNETWTILEEIRVDINGATPIYNAMVSGDTITISTIGGSGRYQLIENIYKKIKIDADNVDLNLAGHTTSQSDASEDIITVSSNQHKVFIFNGKIENTGGKNGAGLLIGSNASQISVEKVNIYNCATGINLNGANDSEIIECTISECELIGNTVGIQLTHADDNVIENCTATSSEQAGFHLSHSEGNILSECQALRTIGTGTNVSGFTSDSGDSNMFERCVAKRTSTSNINFASKVCGFLLTGTETATEIIESSEQKSEVTSSGDAVSYGIALYPTILPNDDPSEKGNLLYEVAADNTPTSTILDIHWSPDEKYLATVDAGNNARVFRFDDSTLTLLYSISFSSPKAIAWSPDSTQLAVGTNSSITVYEFNGFIMTANCSYAGPGTQVNTLKWSPDGAYLAVGYYTGSAGGELRIIGFTGSALIEIDTDTTMDDVKSLDWSPDGNYLICSGTVSSANYLYVFEFNGASINATSANAALGSRTPYSVAWSPNGKYISYGSNNFGDDWIGVYSFSETAITPVYEFSIGSGNTWNSTAWSPDGKYIIACANAESTNSLYALSFNGTTLSQESNPPYPAEVHTVNWSPSGKYVATGQRSSFVRVFDAMTVPEQCLLNNNTTNNNKATGQLASVGILGSGKNMFTQNISGYNTRNYSYGIGNVYWGAQNLQTSFDNISMPVFQ